MEKGSIRVVKGVRSDRFRGFLRSRRTPILAQPIFHQNPERHYY